MTQDHLTSETTSHQTKITLDNLDNEANERLEPPTSVICILRITSDYVVPSLLRIRPLQSRKSPWSTYKQRKYLLDCLSEFSTRPRTFQYIIHVKVTGR